MKKLDRGVFFGEVRVRLHGGRLTQSQVDGYNLDLDIWEKYFRERTPLTQLSVCLATEFHETGARMQPIKELGGTEYLRLNYDVTGRNPERARRMGNIRPGDGVKYAGAGKVQLTWYDNYWRATLRLRELDLIPKDMDFTKNPELVREPRISALIMFIGMEEGWFTGKTLDQLVDPLIDGDEHEDAVRARAIINGKDRAEKIAGHADDYLAALIAAEKAGIVEAAPVVAMRPPDGPVVAKPVEPARPPVTPLPPPEKGFWSKFADLFRKPAA